MSSTEIAYLTTDRLHVAYEIVGFDAEHRPRIWQQLLCANLIQACINCGLLQRSALFESEIHELLTILAAGKQPETSGDILPRLVDYSRVTHPIRQATQTTAHLLDLLLYTAVGCRYRTLRQIALLEAREFARLSDVPHTTDILRDMMGDPFRQAIPPAVTPNIRALARGVNLTILDNGRLDPVGLAALADELEEFGYQDAPGVTVLDVHQRQSSVIGCCDRNADQQACACMENARSEGILEHLRSEDKHHWPGCWVLRILS